MCCCFGGRSSNGVFRLMSYRSAARLISLIKYCEADPGPSPPSSSGFDQSVITLAGSRSYIDPNPWHSGHAPNVELKLKLRGSSLGTSRPQSGQAMEEENSCSSPLATVTRVRPLASWSALATAVSRRFSTEGLPEVCGAADFWFASSADCLS